MIDIIEEREYCPYSHGLKQMMELHSKRERNLINDTFLILEHTPTYTLGKRGGVENIIIKNDIPVFETDRGGNITYHGPGQVVVYPIINIKKINIGIKEYIYRLEELSIKSLEYFGVKATRSKINHGVWVDNKKIASIGVRVKNGITIHGIAININTDLKPFSWINPCGLVGFEATSVKEILHKEVNIAIVKKIIGGNIKNVFPELFSE
ncbi:MAG: lipoyl(octanoyl) transferase LipB [Spirochaetales bacterium]|nr:lipoyl(octanoyl) transferase LipB [Spirochaetales bacterium]